VVNQYKNSIATDINPKSQQAKENVKKNMQVYTDKKKELSQVEKEEQLNAELAAIRQQRQVKLINITETEETPEEIKDWKRSKQILNKLKIGIQNIFENIGCNNELTQELVGSHEVVTESNLIQYLGIIEMRTNEILQMYAACQSKGLEQQQAMSQGQAPTVVVTDKAALEAPTAEAIDKLKQEERKKKEEERKLKQGQLSDDEELNKKEDLNESADKVVKKEEFRKKGRDFAESYLPMFLKNPAKGKAKDGK